jgi:DNA-binding NtrC family response regulator
MSRGQGTIRLLLVDDEVEFLESTSKALSRRGFSVSTAASADEAMRLLELQDFEVAVLDVLMPGMPGDDLFRWMKAMHASLPVIMLTGHGTVKQAFEVSREGVFEYLTKPCDMNELARVARRAAAGRNSELGEENLASIDEVRLLIIDDEVEFLESVSSALARRGMRVHTAASAGEGMERVQEHVFDVVLLDIKLPDIDGVSLIRRIKEKQPEVEVILLTGKPSVDTGVEGMVRGAVDYLIKPCDTDYLANRIRAAIPGVWAKREQAKRRAVDDLLQGRCE